MPCASLVAIASHSSLMSPFAITSFVAIPHLNFTIHAWLATVLEGTTSADLHQLGLQLRKLCLGTDDERIHVRRFYVDRR
jgi:hypothetical protein